MKYWLIYNQISFFFDFIVSMWTSVFFLEQLQLAKPHSIICPMWSGLSQSPFCKQLPSDLSLSLLPPPPLKSCASRTCQASASIYCSSPVPLATPTHTRQTPCKPSLHLQELPRTILLWSAAPSVLPSPLVHGTAMLSRPGGTMHICLMDGFRVVSPEVPMVTMKGRPG